MARFLKLTTLRSAKVDRNPTWIDEVYLNIEHIVSISAVPKSEAYPEGGSILTMTSASDGNSECYYVTESMKTITDNLPI